MGWDRFTHRSERLYEFRKGIMAVLHGIVGMLGGFSPEDYARFKEAEACEIQSVIRGRTVLETGCGLGREAERLLNEFGAWEVIATDVSFGMLLAARPRCSMLVQVDARYLPFADSSVDVIYSNCMYHHVGAHESVLAESLRVGRYIVLIRELIGFRNRFLDILYAFYYSIIDGSFYRPTVDGWLSLLAPYVVSYLHRPERSLVKRYALFTLDATN